MSEKRRYWLLACLLTAVVVIASLQPAVFWRAYAWVRAEPLWRGRPTTYWGRTLAQMSVTASEASRTRRMSTYIPPDDVHGVRWMVWLPLGDYEIHYAWPAEPTIQGYVRRAALTIGLAWRDDRQLITECGADPDVLPVLL